MALTGKKKAIYHWMKDKAYVTGRDVENAGITGYSYACDLLNELVEENFAYQLPGNMPKRYARKQRNLNKHEAQLKINLFGKHETFNDALLFLSQDTDPNMVRMTGKVTRAAILYSQLLMSEPVSEEDMIEARYNNKTTIVHTILFLKNLIAAWEQIRDLPIHDGSREAREFYEALPKLTKEQLQEVEWYKELWEQSNWVDENGLMHIQQRVKMTIDDMKKDSDE